MKEYINEKNLARLIDHRNRHILDMRDENFTYCNAYIIAICTYEHFNIINKLFKVGALKDFKKLIPEEKLDVSKLLNDKGEEFEVEKTKYLVTEDRKTDNMIANVFCINNKYYAYNKKFIDVFENVEFKADFKDAEVPVLRCYSDGNLVGMILGLRWDGINEDIEKIVNGGLNNER